MSPVNWRNGVLGVLAFHGTGRPRETSVEIQCLEQDAAMMGLYPLWNITPQPETREWYQTQAT